MHNSTDSINRRDEQERTRDDHASIDRNITNLHSVVQLSQDAGQPGGSIDGVNPMFSPNNALHNLHSIQEGSIMESERDQATIQNHGGQTIADDEGEYGVG